MEIDQEIRYLLEEIDSVLFSLFQSGFETVQDNMLEELRRLASDAENYGFLFAADGLQELESRLSISRHQFQMNYRETIDGYSKLKHYIILCKEQLERKQVKEEMLNENKQRTSFR